MAKRKRPKRDNRTKAELAALISRLEARLNGASEQEERWRGNLAVVLTRLETKIMENSRLFAQLESYRAQAAQDLAEHKRVCEEKRELQERCDERGRREDELVLSEEAWRDTAEALVRMSIGRFRAEEFGPMLASLVERPHSEVDRAMETWIRTYSANAARDAWCKARNLVTDGGWHLMKST